MIAAAASINIYETERHDLYGMIIISHCVNLELLSRHLRQHRYAHKYYNVDNFSGNIIDSVVFVYQMEIFVLESQWCP